MNGSLRHWTIGALTLFAALVLIVAAILKGLELVRGGLALRDAVVAVVALGELFLGLWLLSRYRPRAANLIALLCFSLFLGVLAVQAYQGASSCGCFGHIRVPAVYTAMLDLSLVAGFYILPRDAAGKSWNRRTLLVLTAMASGAIAAMAFPALLRSASVGPTGRAASKLVVIDAAAWVGSAFPIADDIDLGQRLLSGRWTIMFYHHDCESCRRALPAFEQWASSAAVPDSDTSFALVEIPPLVPGESLAAPRSSSYMIGHLNEQKEWFASTPVLISIEDGIVRSASEGDAAIQTVLSR